MKSASHNPTTSKHVYVKEKEQKCYNVRGEDKARHLDCIGEIAAAAAGTTKRDNKLYFSVVKAPLQHHHYTHQKAVC